MIYGKHLSEAYASSFILSKYRLFDFYSYEKLEKKYFRYCSLVISYSLPEDGEIMQNSCKEYESFKLIKETYIDHGFIMFLSKESEFKRI